MKHRNKTTKIVVVALFALTAPIVKVRKAYVLSLKVLH